MQYYLYSTIRQILQSGIFKFCIWHISLSMHPYLSVDQNQTSTRGPVSITKHIYKYMSPYFEMRVNLLLHANDEKNTCSVFPVLFQQMDGGGMAKDDQVITSQPGSLQRQVEPVVDPNVVSQQPA